MNYIESTKKIIIKGVNGVFPRRNEPLSVHAEPISTAVKSKIAQTTFNHSGLLFIRLAGLSGALAVGLGAYGAHVFLLRKDVPDNVKQVFINGNQYHFLHTLALLAVPLTRRPYLVGSLMTLGMTLFCGTCYVYSLAGYQEIGRIAPYGGTLLIISWLSMLL